MKNLFFVSVSLFFSLALGAQSITSKLNTAFSIFERDTQLKSGIASLYVVNAKTGAVVFSKNEMVGLATASTLKIVTAATAFEVLGKDFQYGTEVGIEGDVKGAPPKGNIYIKPSGDPTLGSWRWNSTKEEALIARWVTALKKSGVSRFKNIIIDKNGWEGEGIPDGWMWQDIGNYYGAGAFGFNWRENQFDVVLSSDSEIGSSVKVVNTVPTGFNVLVNAKLTAAARGTGDNAYVYYPLGEESGIIRGTIPVNEKKFVISAAFPNPSVPFLKLFEENLSKAGIKSESFTNYTSKERKVIYTEKSPPLDSIIYWFLKKSINLYGEALVKTMAFQKEGIGSTEKGVTIVKDFWKDKGIARTELNMVDGSGLSPLNRVTTHAQVMVLQYAKKHSWYSSFFNALPEYNGMKTKSGTINGVKGFTGYHTAKNGEEYIFSFLVNNYNGSAGTIVQKMYKVLDVLK
jgi:D-alanyl-D-alanine carboxypeptidase/D-alanyl-D-alanine-endopeptidase (penicillin-binding protein 4)